MSKLQGLFAYAKILLYQYIVLPVPSVDCGVHPVPPVCYKSVLFIYGHSLFAFYKLNELNRPQIDGIKLSW